MNHYPGLPMSRFTTLQFTANTITTAKTFEVTTYRGKIIQKIVMNYSKSNGRGRGLGPEDIREGKAYQIHRGERGKVDLA